MEKLPTPYYIVYEDKLRANLELISDVARRGDVEIIMAFKANALWKTFPIIGEYVKASTASSLNEMKLSLDFLGGDVHSYCPVYTDSNFPDFLAGCSHITFNSIEQYEHFRPLIVKHNELHPEKRVSPGLRINPGQSVVGVDIYDACAPGSRFGVTEDRLNELPEGIEGLHFHALCESDSKDLEKVLESVRSKFGHLLPKLKWLNMGGGHLMTRKGYDIDLLLALLNKLHEDYPGMKLIMEPGSAFTWQTGDLVTEVLDVVENSGIRTAIIDASFACHMPDCLEMPYKPAILEALPDDEKEGVVYRLGGNSCLSGDFVGTWSFKTPLKAGDRITLLDMNHYTTVKTTMFNGIQHPDIYLKRSNNETLLLRHFSYEDYRDRMD